MIKYEVVFTSKRFINTLHEVIEVSDFEIEDLKIVLFIEKDIPNVCAFLDAIDIGLTNAAMKDLETNEEIKLNAIRKIHVAYNRIELELKEIITD